MDSIKCVFVAREDVDSVVQFARDQFLHDEPLCRQLNLKGESGFDEYFRHSVEQGTSVMAIDTARDNLIVGVRAHRVETREEYEKRVQEKPEKDNETPATADDPCLPLLRAVDFAFDRFNPWEKYEHVDKLLYFKFLSVHREYRGKNVSKRMTDFTFDFMRQEGIPLAYVWATSAFSRAVFLKAGFEVVDEMLYSEYTDSNGQVLFQPEAIHKGWATLVKWLN